MALHVAFISHNALQICNSQFENTRRNKPTCGCSDVLSLQLSEIQNNTVQRWEDICDKQNKPMPIRTHKKSATVIESKLSRQTFCQGTQCYLEEMVSNDRDQTSFSQWECGWWYSRDVEENTNGGNIRASQEVIKPCVKSFKVLKQDKQLFTMMQTI